MDTLFPTDALRKALARFPLSKIPDIRGKRAIVGEWIKQLQSGKLVKLKEEEVKSRFVTEFFGDVLGFNYGNSTSWQLREEVRTNVDATKPDAALGYFSHDGRAQVCRAVIEIKDAATELDAKQRRENPKSAVDQGFEYAPKMGPDCQWVIVSNIQEIRFYRANDRTKCQRYLLAELEQDEKLKELLLLFHKDRFIVRAGESKTDKLLRHAVPVADTEQGGHIVDELYASLQRFDGLNFVNPNYLAALYPFNILEEHVWHYQEGSLLTINPHICRLLDGLSVQDKQLEFSETLLEELTLAGVVNYEEKLKWIINFLNRCQITRFRAVWEYQSIEARNKRTIGFSEKTFFSFAESDGVEKDLNLLPSGPCSCLICIYRNLDLTQFLSKLKSAAGHEEYETMEYAYGNYLAATNNFRAAHDIYKRIEQRTKNQEGNEITYFLAKQNRSLTHNLLRGHYYHDDQKQLLSEIREIDMVSVVSDELEGAIEPEVRAYLLDVTSKDLIYNVKDELEEKKEGIIKRKHSLEQGGWFSGPNYLLNAWYEYILLYRHVNLNYLVYDTFKDYRNVAKRLIEAALLSYSTAKAGEQTVDKFFLTEAIFHVDASDLAELLKQIKKIEVTAETKQEILAKTKNLLCSFYKDGIFGDPYLNSIVEEFMLSGHFEQNITNVFSNLFLILSYIPLETEDVSDIMPSLIAFMSVERYLAWHDIKHLKLFLNRKGELLSQPHLLSLLKLSLLENRIVGNRYEPLIEPIVEALHKQYSIFQIEDKNLIRKVVGNCYAIGSTRASFKHLTGLHCILSPACLVVLQVAIREHLDEQFDADLYRSLLWDDTLMYTEGSYFAQWVSDVNSTKGKGYQGIENGHPKFHDYDFFNFALLIYAKDIPLETTELQQFSNLSPFEQWLIQPELFDYASFELNWLAALDYPQFFERLKQIGPLRQTIENKLDAEFNPKAYELYHKHFRAE